MISGQRRKPRCKYLWCYCHLKHVYCISVVVLNCLFLMIGRFTSCTKTFYVGRTFWRFWLSSRTAVFWRTTTRCDKERHFTVQACIVYPCLLYFIISHHSCANSRPNRSNQRNWNCKMRHPALAATLQTLRLRRGKWKGCDRAERYLKIRGEMLIFSGIGAHVERMCFC